MPGPSKEQISQLRWLTIIAGSVLFVADFGFDALAKEVPAPVYYVLGAIALGIDIRQIREVVLSFLRTWAGMAGKGKDNE